MSKSGQQKTKEMYQNSKVVRAYIEEHTQGRVVTEYIGEIAPKISGKKVIDIGCGPGWIRILLLSWASM